jgi:hypothetical protein
MPDGRLNASLVGAQDFPNNSGACETTSHLKSRCGVGETGALNAASSAGLRSVRRSRSYCGDDDAPEGGLNGLRFHKVFSAARGWHPCNANAYSCGSSIASDVIKEALQISGDDVQAMERRIS